MRLHGKNPEHTRFKVWHCPTCKYLNCVLWVDDETAQWFEVQISEGARHLVVFGYDDIPGVVHQAKRIQILMDMHLVLIDPLDQVDPAPIVVHKVVGVNLPLKVTL